MGVLSHIWGQTGDRNHLFWEIFDALETKANRTILTQAAFFRMYKELFILFSHDPIELKEYELCSNA